MNRGWILLPLSFLIAGCDAALLDPSGDLAVQQRDLMYFTTFLILLIVVPVIVATLMIAWKYRASNLSANYQPEWDHSSKLEYLIWGSSCTIIVILGTVTWFTTHSLDPYKPLEHPAKPIEVQVVALDWKWLFIYPEQGIATVNEMAAPVDTPINFRITSGSVMNSFFIPAIAGQIYAMAGMETKLHAIANRTGNFDGLSANYSGDGFSHMRFRFHALEQAGFDDWVARVRDSGDALDRSAYLALEKPSEREPVRYYGRSEPEMFEMILNMCVDSSKMCAHHMMEIDRAGGGGLASIDLQQAIIASLCTVEGGTSTGMLGALDVQQFKNLLGSPESLGAFKLSRLTSE